MYRLFENKQHIYYNQPQYLINLSFLQKIHKEKKKKVAYSLLLLEDERPHTTSSQGFGHRTVVDMNAFIMLSSGKLNIRSKYKIALKIFRKILNFTMTSKNISKAFWTYQKQLPNMRLIYYLRSRILISLSNMSNKKQEICIVSKEEEGPVITTQHNQLKVHRNKYGKPVIIFGPALSW
ncbi:hypothetical protein ACJX0J_036512, partial [Zea mays]